jgi:UDP-2,4-diacetamido-2,4,6-trideoxy-beta-L-altropyranose hydrolase
MLVVIRTDSSLIIGSGHVMRCLTLADYLRDKGVDVVFICRVHNGHLCDLIQSQGFPVNRLSMTESIEKSKAGADCSGYASWLGATWQEDAIDTGSILDSFNLEADWLIVDHYALDSRWESSLRQSAKNILVIDDIADRQHDCDALLDQNFYTDMGTRYVGKVPSHCRLFLGPRFALLRKEFRQLHQQVKPRSGTVKCLLVFFGGVDFDNYTGRTIRALSEIGVSNLRIDVVIGSQHPYIEQIKAECIQHKFICHVQTDKMAKLMSIADFAIGAGGSATWERCCLGLPALVLSLADNQTEIAKGLDILGAGQYMDSQCFANIEDMHRVIFDFMQSKNKLESFSKKAYSLVDGLGVDRLYKELLQ